MIWIAQKDEPHGKLSEWRNSSWIHVSNSLINTFPECLGFRTSAVHIEGELLDIENLEKK